MKQMDLLKWIKEQEIKQKTNIIGWEKYEATKEQLKLTCGNRYFYIPIFDNKGENNVN